ncbi:NADP-specific glutamate dehydrogenase [Isoalcanivorax beigongshangi]|uniref:NADP-specific glutamate dehydrogenase n=1 Tax=Isoalcanivorax beigongshangi TaxID=3238810 RepID=UPI003F6EA1AC
MTQPIERLDQLLQQMRQRDPGEPEFHQAVETVLRALWPDIENREEIFAAGILDRLIEPERVIQFRVPWVDDQGVVRVNRGYRVQMNSAIGPYKGGIRFHPSVNAGVLKFLAFEQTLKNGLTTLPMGGGKGGADFDPKGKSEGEVMRFCQSFMTELQRHIGPNLDVPAGDIGVGAREVGYMFGQYKRLKNEFTGVLTGKGLTWGGSLLRPEATGYGLVYFVEEMLRQKGSGLDGMRVALSGSGNVAQYAMLMLVESGAKVLTLSDSSGTVVNEEGFTRDHWRALMTLKNEKRGRLSELAAEFNLKYLEGERPWANVSCDVALPCATQNELDEADAAALLKNGCYCIAEGSNMGCTADAVSLFRREKVLYAPSKAANAGGVSVSGLEMSQNSLRLLWTEGEVDEKLHAIMHAIHNACVKYGRDGDHVDYVRGANVAGFMKVAEAMLAQGVV